jgi:ABC-2 type transport system permease protein
MLALCALAPFAFVVALVGDGRVPEDTLFGRWALTSGFAIPLVVMGFAPAYVFPALSSVVAGDLFASEDRHRTWQALLTRGVSRTQIFFAKALTSMGVTAAGLVTLGLASLVAGTTVVGRQPLLGLSGIFLPPAAALRAVALAWATLLPPAFAFTALALLFSMTLRSGPAGVGLPVVVGFVMDLAAVLVQGSPLRHWLLTAGFVEWHGIVTTPTYVGGLAESVGASVIYSVMLLIVTRAVFVRRDVVH